MFLHIQARQTRRVSHPALRPTPRVASHSQRCATPRSVSVPRQHDERGSNLWVRAEGSDNSDDKSAFLKTMPYLFEERPQTPHNPPRQPVSAKTFWVAVNSSVLDGQPHSD